jgi:hypothetical protein
MTEPNTIENGSRDTLGGPLGWFLAENVGAEVVARDPFFRGDFYCGATLGRHSFASQPLRYTALCDANRVRESLLTEFGGL